MNRNPEFEILFALDSTFTVSETIHGTLVVTTHAPTKPGACYVALLDGEDQVARAMLTREALGIGRHEMSFQVPIPRGVISFTGRLLFVNLTVQGVLESGRLSYRSSPSPIEVVVAGDLFAKQAEGVWTRSSDPNRHPIGEPPRRGLFGLIDDFAGTRVSPQPSSLEMIQVHVEPTKAGIAARFEVGIDVTCRLRKVGVRLVGREMRTWPLNPDPRRTRKPSVVDLKVRSRTCLEDSPASAGDLLSFQFDYDWRDTDPANMRLGYKRFFWLIEVTVDVAGEHPCVVEVPLDVVGSKKPPERVPVATERPPEV